MSHTNATESDVLDLMDTDLSSSEITPFIDTAKRIVTDKLEGKGVADATLTELEAYLAAHFATLKDPDSATSQQSVGDTSATYQGETGTGLNATRFGQSAVALDPTGTLAAIAQQKRGVIHKVGVYST